MICLSIAVLTTQFTKHFLIKRKSKSPNATVDKISFLNVKNKVFFYKRISESHSTYVMLEDLLFKRKQLCEYSLITSGLFFLSHVQTLTPVNHFIFFFLILFFFKELRLLALFPAFFSSPTQETLCGGTGSPPSLQEQCCFPA